MVTVIRSTGQADDSRKKSEDQLESVRARVREKKMEQQCQDVIDALKAKGFNFVCIDFDQTIVDVHTGGQWRFPAEDLESHVRPFFRCFIPLLLRNDMLVSVVTFSGQMGVITDVLRRAFPEFYEEIPIRGIDGSWEYVGKGNTCGKQAHMASAATELKNRRGTEITRESTILIDDDEKNIRIALEDGTKAVWFDPASPHTFVDRLYHTVTNII